MSQAQLSAYARDLKMVEYKRDGWKWFGDQAKTFAEHDKQNPVKPFPVHKEYLWVSYSLWLMEEWLIVEKSRQLLYSWLFSGAHLHLAQFTDYRKVMLASKNEDDAIALLERIWFMYSKQDDDVREAYPAERTGNIIQFKNGSQIIAIPRGKHKMRSYVCSALFADEFGFIEDGSELFGAAIPALTGGGRITCVSTANPGLMEEIVKAAKRFAGRHRVVMEGLELWHSPAENRDLAEDNLGAGFSVMRTHYSVDPDEYAQNKVKQARSKYQSVGRLPWFNKEYEIVYDALSGEMVWPQLDRNVHGVAPFTIPDEWTRLRVIDPGFRNPCAVLWVAISPAGWRGCVHTDDKGNQTKLPVMVVYQELHQKGLKVPEIAAAIHHRSGQERFSVDLIDPSSDIHKGNEVAGLSTMEQFQELGLKLIKANNTVEPGLDEVRRRLGVYGQSAALLIFNNLENTWRECMSYRYREVSARVLEHSDAPEAVRKKDDHIPDCLRYACQWRPLPNKDGTKIVPFNSFAHARKMESPNKRGSWAGVRW